MRIVFPLLILLAIPTSPAHAAESYDGCGGYIDSIPATITTQGTWCLRADLSTAIASGNAIEIATNNVTLDCNHFKLGGLAAGLGTQAVGVNASNRLNTTVRNCNVRGFSFGARLTGGGHVVEDSRFEANRLSGVRISGDGNIVRRNLIVDTGESTTDVFVSAIRSDAGRVLIQDNVVNGVVSSVFGNFAGIQVSYGQHSLIEDNYVSGLVGDPGDYRIGVYASSSPNALFRGNTVAFVGPGLGYGAYSEFVPSNCRDNVWIGVAIDSFGCTDLGGNNHVP